LTFTRLLVKSKATVLQQSGCRFGDPLFVVLAKPRSEEATW
jgi:hypothetical protein